MTSLSTTSQQPSAIAPPSCSPVRAWLAVAILWLFYVISFMDRGVIALLVQPIMADLHISPVQMGILQGFAFAITYSVAALPLGWAVDHWRRRRILFAGVLVWSLGTLACGWADRYEHMVWARAVMGVGEAVLTPTALSLIADMFPKQRIAMATAVFSSGATVGVGAALILGGSLLRHFAAQGGPLGVAPWQAVFLIFGTVGMVSAGLSWCIPDARPPSTALRKPVASLAAFGRFLGQQWRLLACLFVAFPLLLAISNAYLAWTPHHFEADFGWDAQRTGMFLGSMNLVLPIIGVIAGGYAMDRALRVGVRAPYIVVPLLSTLLGVPLLAAGLLSDHAGVAIFLLALGLLIFNAFAAAQGTLVQLLAPPDMRGRFAAIYMLIVSLVGSGLGALLPPLINSAQAAGQHDVGWATAMAILSIGTVVAVALWLGRSRLHQALTSAEPAPAGAALPARLVPVTRA